MESGRVGTRGGSPGARSQAEAKDLPKAPGPSSVYEAVLDRSQAAVFSLDADGACLRASPICLETPAWYQWILQGLTSHGAADSFAEFEDLRRRVVGSGEVGAGILKLAPQLYLEYGIVPDLAVERGGATVTVWDVTGRISAQRECARHERRLRAVLDASPIPLVVVDSAGLIELWNPAAERASGLSAAEVVGHHPEESFPELAGIVKEIASRMTQGPIRNVPITWHREDDETLELRGSFALIDDPANGPDSAVGAIVDIGPILERERRISRLNRVTSLMATIDAAIFTVDDPVELLQEACRIAVDLMAFETARAALLDADGQLRLVAGAGIAWLTSPEMGSGPTAPDSDGLLAVAVRDCQPVIRERLSSEVGGRRGARAQAPRGSAAAFPILRRGRAIGAIEFHSSAGGAIDDQETRLLSAAAEHLSFALAGLETERRRGEAEARYRSLFEQSPQPMMITDAATRRIVAVNDAAVAVYGYERPEFLTHSIDDIAVQGETPEGLARTVVPLGTPVVARHVRRDGRVMEVEVSGHEIEFDGRAAQVIGIIDVTERSELQDRLAQAAKVEAIGQLAGGIAHDFNNILAAVVGYADLLVDALGEDPRAQDAREIARAGRRGADLTHQLLAFARRQVLVPRPVDLNEVILGVAPMLRRLVGEDVELVTRPAPRAAVVEVDPVQLERVLVNLAVNARDAMPDGGHLHVAVDLPRRSARLRHRLAGPAVLLTVADTGVGMTADAMAHVFEPFFSTKSAKGTGLGLATVHGIVAQSGGEIWAESRPASGTTFSILLPLSSLEAEPLAITEPHTAPERPGGSVLVVEDDPDVRRLAVRVLESEGYRVLVASSAAQAEALAAAGEPIDLLLTDLVMPGGNGSDLADRLQARWPNLRVLYMSGYDPGLPERLAPERLANFLAKPFEPDELCERVRNSLAR